MARRISLGCVLLAMLWGAEVRADPFTILPDGSVVYNTALTTTGVFQCDHIKCSGAGTNSVTLESGGKEATITFTGLATMLQVTNTVQQVPIGTFDAVATPGFTFPERWNVGLPLLHFRLFFEHTSPNPASGNLFWTFGPGGDAQLPHLTGISSVALPLTVNPPHVGYSAFVYTTRPFPFKLPSNGSLDLFAKVAVVPEPGTIVLVGSGIAGLIGARRRRCGAKRLIVG